LLGRTTNSSGDSELLTDLPPEIVSLLQEHGAQLPQSIRMGKLPEELVEMIRERVPSDALPMSFEEAKEHRLRLMKERSNHVMQSEDAWQEHAYSFCEH